MACARTAQGPQVEADAAGFDAPGKDTMRMESAAAERQGEEMARMLLPYKSVIDTLSAQVSSEYFFHDINGDGQDELWLRYGTCEADTRLSVYASTNGRVRQLLSDYGGHTEFFLNGNTLGSITVNTGVGYVNVYSWWDGKISVISAPFSMYNEKGVTQANNKYEQYIIDFWNTCDSIIPYKDLDPKQFPPFP